jgi:tetratricopeptide (TPR) repeat protein
MNLLVPPPTTSFTASRRQHRLREIQFMTISAKRACPSLVAISVLSAVALSSHARAASSTASITNDAKQFASDKPVPLQPIFEALYIEGEHNAVLNLDYLGLAAMETGDYTIAEKAFDAAIERIEAIYADNPNAQKAKSVFAAEKVKDFKGEPYERAMTYYYRGVLYLHSGDYQNARASFLSAERQTTLSEAESYDSTFGLMDYLAGWASSCDGDQTRAKDLADRAAKAQPQIFGSLQPTVTYIGLVDVGTGPVKVAVGQYKEKLTFKAGDDSVGAGTIQASSASIGDPVVAGDINWQATTRGGRPVDAILNGKAEWKGGTSAAASVMGTVGYAAALQGAITGNNNLSAFGGLSMLAGFGTHLVAKAMTAEADTRTWSNLPGTIVLTQGQVQADGVPGESFVVSPAGATVTTVLNARAGQCGFSWGRTNPSLSVAIAHVSRPVAAEDQRDAVNAQFRSLLASTFAATQRTASN